MLSAVCDAGPLIHLAEIQQVELLGQFSPLIIPATILAEARTLDAPPSLQFIVLRPSPEEAAEVARRVKVSLDPGELDAIALCLNRPNVLFLCDDLKGRREAERLSLPVAGCVGIIVRAFCLQLLTLLQAEHALRQLGNCRTLFIGRSIIETALKQIRDNV